MSGPLYRVRHVRTGMYLEAEIHRAVGLVVNWVGDARVRSFPRAQAQALASVWIAVSGDHDVEIEPAS